MRGSVLVARRGIIALIVAGIALAGCSSSSKSAPEATNPATPKDRPKVTITARDFSFTVPAQIPSGYVDVTLDNRGKEDHQAQLVKLGSATFAQFKAYAVKTDLGKVKAGTIFLGGPNLASPGKATTSTVKLEPGKYAVVCFVPSADKKSHAAKGMIGEVEVVKTAESSETAPAAAATIILGDYSFTVPAGFTGKGTVDISNQGNEVHELGLLKVAPGLNQKQALAAVIGPEPLTGPPPVEAITGVVGLSPQQHAWLNLDLDPGNYLLICFFPSPARGGAPHFALGMVKLFTIS